MGNIGEIPGIPGTGAVSGLTRVDTGYFGAGIQNPLFAVKPAIPGRAPGLH